MWHSRFFGTLLSLLALLGFMESQTALAAYPTSSEFSMSQTQETRGLEGSFQLAVMGDRAVPMDMPPEESTEKVQPEKPAVETPKATQGESTEDHTVPLDIHPEKSPVKVQSEKPVVETPKATLQASKPKKKKVKEANVETAPAKKPVEEESFLTKTFKQLIGGDDDKKEAASKSQMQKTAVKKPEKEEEGLLTKTLKKLVGGDQKEEQAAKKNPLNPINTAPTGSTTQKKGEEQPKTAKSETKKTLKDSFEKLIGVGAVKDEGDSKSAKTDKPAGETKSAKKEKSGGLLDGILGGSNKKKDSSATKQAKVKNTVKETSAPAKPRKITAKKYAADNEEEEQLEKNRGGVKKGKNVLKESFKTLITDDKKKENAE